MSKEEEKNLPHALCQTALITSDTVHLCCASLFGIILLVFLVKSLPNCSTYSSAKIIISPLGW